MSTTARGSKSFLSWLPETTYGVKPTGNFNALSFVSETLTGQINPIISTEITKSRSTPSARGGNIMTGGNIVTDFSGKRFAIWLAHLMGAAPVSTVLSPVTVADATLYKRGDVVKGTTNDFLCVGDGTTGTGAATALNAWPATLGLVQTNGTADFVFFDPTATGKHKHVFSPANDFLPNGIFFEKAILGQTTPFYLQYAGGRLDKLNMSIPQDGIVQATWDWLFASKETNLGSSGAGTPVEVAEDPFVGFEGGIVFDNADRGTVKTANFTISNDSESDDYRIGSRFRASIPPRRRALSGSLTCVFEDNLEYTYFAAETTFALKFTFYHSDWYLEFLFPQCKIFGDASPKVGGGGIITSQFAFTGFAQNFASTPDVQITLINTDAAYTV